MTTDPPDNSRDDPAARAAPLTRALPLWARAADGISVTLVVVGVLIGAFGGFRLRNAWWRIEVTSPYRVWMWAALILIVRHLIIRRPPIHAFIQAHLARWSRSPAVRAATSVTVSTRFAMFAVGLLAVVLFGYANGTPPWRDNANELINLPMRWDAGWYIQIAQHGYSFIPSSTDIQQNIVFFPAYPVVVRVAALLLGNSQPAYAAGATVASLAAFLFGLTYLYLLTREMLDEEQTVAALWMLASYPFALFYGAVYTEALFLLAAVGAFYHCRRGEFLIAGAWGLLSGLTRPNGGFLALPLALIAISPWLPAVIVGGPRRVAASRRDADRGAGRDTRRLIAGLATAAICGGGTLAYTAYIWALTGDPLAWVSGHAAWGRHYEAFTEQAMNRYQFLQHEGLYTYIVERPLDLINGVGAMFVMASAFPVWRRFGLAFAVFILVNMLPPIASGGLLSAGRFSSVMFPAFMWLGAVVPARQRVGVIVAFASWQALNAALFYTWRPMF